MKSSHLRCSRLRNLPRMSLTAHHLRRRHQQQHHPHRRQLNCSIEGTAPAAPHSNMIYHSLDNKEMLNILVCVRVCMYYAEMYVMGGVPYMVCVVVVVGVCD